MARRSIFEQLFVNPDVKERKLKIKELEAQSKAEQSSALAKLFASPPGSGGMSTGAIIGIIVIVIIIIIVVVWLVKRQKNG